MGRSNLPLNDVNGLFSADDSPLHLLAVLLIVITVICVLIDRLLKTDLGIAIRATGNNEKMASANGIQVNRMKITGLALANGLTALSGYLLVQYQGFADINMGVGIVISGLAAVMMGESLSSLFRTNKTGIVIVSVVTGSILFRLILAEALSLGLNPNYLKLVTALIVLMIVGITRFKTKHHAEA
jgi:putative ABC transport system permease protein